MRRVIALALSLSLLLCGCVNAKNIDSSNASDDESNRSIYNEITPRFQDLNDEKLISYIKSKVYSDLVNELNSKQYFVENVDAVYISKEYIEELSFNSQENIFFGYKLSDLDECFQAQKYVFNVDDKGGITVSEFEKYDDTYDKIIKNVAIGSGVIIVCITVSLVTADAGLPAVSMIFAASAKSGTIMGLSSSAIGGVSAGIIKGIESGDVGSALKHAALTASKDFKFGAVFGALLGGAGESVKYIKAMKAIKGSKLNGLTTQEAAAIQMKSKYPVDVIKQFKSYEEYQAYEKAGLKPFMVDGKLSLTQDIDLKYVSELPDGSKATNLMRMKKGYSPIEPASGKPYELHHINQDPNGTLAVLTSKQHDDPTLHIAKDSEIDRRAFDKIRKLFWESYAKGFAGE